MMKTKMDAAAADDDNDDCDQHDSDANNDDDDRNEDDDDDTLELFRFHGSIFTYVECFHYFWSYG